MPKAKTANKIEVKKVTKSSNKDVNLIAGGLSSLSFTLQGALTHDTKSKSKAPIKNLVYSPFCLYSTLAALKFGTNGKTGNELEKILNFPSDSSVLSSAFRNILPSLQSSQFPPEFTLHIASRIFVSAGVQIGKEFLDSVENTFGENVTISTLDFGSKEAAVKEINKWASSATGNLVKDVVTQKTFEIQTSEKRDKNSQLKMLIVSAVYFKGFWNVDFPEFVDETFNPINGNPFQVQMMYRYFTPVYVAEIENLDAKVFEVPYKDDRLSMIFYFPKEPNGLSKIESDLKDSPNPPSHLLKILYNKKTRKPAVVHMPKFKFECALDLTEPLKKTRLVKMFTPGPDFSSLTSSKNDAEVFKVVQKVVFQVDEKGIKTPMINIKEEAQFMPITWAFVDQIYMRHPFYFQIVDKRNDTVILAGACMNPSKT